MVAATFDEFHNYLTLLVGKSCCHVFAGGSAGSRLSLSLGEEKREQPSAARALQGLEYPECEGEIGLFVKSAWRLDGPSAPVSSSDEDTEAIGRAVTVLAGEKILNVELFEPAWDLCITFTGDLQLRVFCDRVTGDPGFDYNWHVGQEGTLIAAGPGYRLQIEHRDE